MGALEMALLMAERADEQMQSLADEAASEAEREHIAALIHDRVMARIEWAADMCLSGDGE